MYVLVVVYCFGLSRRSPHLVAEAWWGCVRVRVRVRVWVRMRVRVMVG